MEITRLRAGFEPCWNGHTANTRPPPFKPIIGQDGFGSGRIFDAARQEPTTCSGSNPALSDGAWVGHRQRAETRRRYALAGPCYSARHTREIGRDVGFAKSGFRPTFSSPSPAISSQKTPVQNKRDQYR
jgi:hypothetical protein